VRRNGIKSSCRRAGGAKHGMTCECESKGGMRGSKQRYAPGTERGAGEAEPTQGNRGKQANVGQWRLPQSVWHLFGFCGFFGSTKSKFCEFECDLFVTNTNKLEMPGLWHPGNIISTCRLWWHFWQWLGKGRQAREQEMPLFCQSRARARRVRNTQMGETEEVA